MEKQYPIDIADMLLPENDCACGVKIMRFSASKLSARVFDRKNRDGNLTPYYEYKDTAMSRLSHFKPEWIKELRLVDDSNPDNPDVIYNNGHFMHQMTFFIGPVNFYYEVDGKKHCTEMNTGDSNYITPFFKHSFTSRDKNQLSLIIAVTFGGDVRRAQKELYALGTTATQEYALDYRDAYTAETQLIKQHLNNENITLDGLQELIDQQGLSLDISKLMDKNCAKSPQDLKILAKLLHVDVNDFMITQYKPEEEVVVKKLLEQDGYFYPSKQQPCYKIYPLARTTKMPLVKGFNIIVLSQEGSIEHAFVSSLQQYIYNYGQHPVKITWLYEEMEYSKLLDIGDSCFILPFVKHYFTNTANGNASLVNIRVSGAVNLSTQRELSYLSSVDRVAYEKTKWFN